ncbi:MAG: DUF2064 domain-containing protein [Bacteriovoracaceae bacterium]|nr:DUF2064 domain-containing protein [Bacteriovoracaceae bacterium]
MKTTALICFVKTPGLSPLKTRLSEGLGHEKSLECYSQMIEIVRETFSSAISTLGLIECFWAVAEAKGLNNKIWSTQNTILQSTGPLSNRLHHAQFEENGDFRQYIYIGSDAPALNLSYIRRTIVELQSSDHVIGPAKDGGFYLFASKIPLSLELWNSIPFSTSTTFKNLCHALPGKVVTLSELSDIDQVSDLSSAIKELEELEIRSKSQEKFISYLKGLQVTSMS